jgi:predicted dehydrogenase
MNNKEIKVGIIGTGRRGITCLGKNMILTHKKHGLNVTGLYDVNLERAKEAKLFLQELASESNVKCEPEIYNSYEALINSPEIDLILISSPTSFHKEHAMAAIKSGKMVYCDKPLAHTADDAVCIAEQEARYNKKIILGFTRRYEDSYKQLYSLLQDGIIGDLKMMQLRAVIPYWRYFQRWHRRLEWGGGAINDKASHFCDLLRWFSASNTIRLNATGGQAIFKADENAPERCLTCDRDCPYREGDTEGGQDQIASFGDSWEHETEEFFRCDNCVYMPGADSQDHFISNIQFENGVLASVFISFFGPEAEDQETFELVGSKGRMILTRYTGTIDVVTDYGKTTKTIDCKYKNYASSHFGADINLMQQLAEAGNGKTPDISAVAGLESTRMIEAILQSISNNGENICLETIPNIKK